MVRLRLPVLTLSLFIVGVLNRAWAQEDVYRQLNRLGEVFERIRSELAEKPDDATLIDGAINGMLRSVDPRASYIGPKEFRDMQVKPRGDIGAVGIEITKIPNGLIKVVAPVDGSPAVHLVNDPGHDWVVMGQRASSSGGSTILLGRQNGEQFDGMTSGSVMAVDLWTVGEDGSGRRPLAEDVLGADLR